MLGSTRPSRLLRGVVCLSIVAGLANLPASQASATADEPVTEAECAEAFERMMAWAERESRRGLSSRMLDQLRGLVPVLSGCGASAPPPGGMTPSTSPYRGMGDGARGWAAHVARFFEPEDVERVLCLMDAESGGNPEARNPSSGAAGLMQVMPFWAGAFGYVYDDLFDPEVNLWIARQIRDRQGWPAWSPYLRGVCAW